LPNGSTTIERCGRQTRVALDHAGLHNGATHRIHYAAKFDNAAIACALDDAAVMHRDGGIDQVAPQRP
jgi:hypothetical protein